MSADHGGNNLISCSNVTKSDTSYCCDPVANCCDSGVQRFEVLPSNPGQWARWDEDKRVYKVVGTMYGSKSTSTSPSSKTSASTISNLPAATDTDRSHTPASSSKLSTGALAGIGVSAAVGAILIVTVGFLLWKIRRDGKARKAERPHWPPSYSGLLRDQVKNPSTVHYQQPSYQMSTYASRNRVFEVHDGLPRQAELQGS